MNATALAVPALARLASAAAPFSPLTAYGANTELWLDAADGATRFQDTVGGTPSNDADPVGAWADKSGKLDAGTPRHATQATISAKPSYSAAKVALTFDGADLIVTPTFTLVPQPFTLIIVGLLNGNTQALCDNTIAPRTILQRGASATTYVIHNGTSLTTGAASPDLSARRAYMGVFNGASSESRLNNVLQLSGAAGALGCARLSLGGISGVIMTGEICEVILVSRLLSAGERTTLQAYLSGKWGV